MVWGTIGEVWDGSRDPRGALDHRTRPRPPCGSPNSSWTTPRVP